MEILEQSGELPMNLPNIFSFGRAEKRLTYQLFCFYVNFCTFLCEHQRCIICSASWCNYIRSMLCHQNHLYIHLTAFHRDVSWRCNVNNKWPPMDLLLRYSTRVHNLTPTKMIQRTTLWVNHIKGNKMSVLWVVHQRTIPLRGMLETLMWKYLRG